MRTQIRVASLALLMLGGYGCKEQSETVGMAKPRTPVRLPATTLPAPAPSAQPALPPSALLQQPVIESGHFGVKRKGDQVSLPGMLVTLPKGWTLNDSVESPRLARFVTPESLEVSVFWFGKAGGTVEDNLKRWEGLFSPLDSREVVQDTLHNPRIAFGRWQGGFHGDMGHATIAKNGPAVLLAAIVQTEKGSVFFKAVGSVPQTSAARGLLREMLWGAQLEH